MTTYTWENLDDWLAKNSKVLNAVVKTSTSRLVGGIEVVPGINRGGSRRKGTIPRDIGALASSMRSSLMGSTAAVGEAAWVGVVGGMKAGDVARFSWGGAVAPYAAHVYYGANGIEGTHWIEERAKDWQSIVRTAAIEARGMF